MSISENFEEVKKLIPPAVKLIAVSKTQPVEVIKQAFDVGQRLFGENRVQELVDKYEQLPKEIEWHLIGHLQKNKVKFIAPFISMIHSVDEVDLLKVIQKEAEKVKRVIPVLLQIHIAEEETKYGFDFKEAEMFLSNFPDDFYSNIRITGLMGMASFTEDRAQVRNEFRGLKEFFKKMQEGPMKSNPDFKELSMGMSGDFSIAIEEESTMVRIGRRLF